MHGSMAVGLGSAALPRDAEADTTTLVLSEEQREVVAAPPGPLLVLAGAGSGKTRALTQRVARFLRAGAAPDRVLLMTFTNQAARQMLARLQAQCRRLLDGLWVGTFHHLALRVLRRHGFRIGLPERFAVLDRNDSADLLLSCLAEQAPPTGRTWPRPLLLQSLFSLAVNAELPLAAALQRYAPEWRELAPELGRVCDRYVERKLRMGLCDFDDLLLGWRLLLCDCPQVLAEQQAQFQHVFIDEYQDVSPVQSVLCDDLARGHGHLTAVGDDAQSIYRFRGADLGSLLTFRQRWPEARVLHLSTNYRSRPDIVALSNRSIANNAHAAPRPPMRAALAPSAGDPAVAALPLGELAQRPALISLPDARVQAAFVVQRIAELLAAGRPADEIAILYRHHRHARELQLELLRAQIPYRLRSGPRLAEQTHIKDVLSFLRLCQNPRDQLAWGRVLRQVAGIGDTGRARLLAALAQQAQRGEVPALDHTVLAQVRPHCRAGLRQLAQLLAELRALRDELAAQRSRGAEPSELPARLLEHVIERHYRAYASHAYTDAEQRLLDLDGLRRGLRARPMQATLPLGAESAELTLGDFLSALATGDELEAAAASRARGEVVLSTVHQAKGLEWGVVFVLWLSEGHFPSAAALLEADDEGGLEAAEAEERRLFYVAITRAQKELYLCYPSAAATQGALRMSRFLRELDGQDPPFERWAIQVG